MSKQKRTPPKLPAQSTVPNSKPQVLQRIEPQVMPSQHGWNRNRLLIWVAVIVVVGQLTLPEPLKPFFLAGDAAAMFHRELFSEVNRKELELLQQQAIAQKIADLQAEYASWKGICALTGTFDPVAGAKCMQAADNYFQNALRQIRGSDLIYR